MTWEILSRITVGAPEDWIYFKDTDHAHKYALEVFNNAAKYIQLEFQLAYFKHLYRERKGIPEGDLDELALIAFQVQFNRECIEELERLLKSTAPSMSK